MWTKTVKPHPVSALPRPQTAVRAPVLPSKPARVLQSSRVPQQLSFEFRRG